MNTLIKRGYTLIIATPAVILVIAATALICCGCSVSSNNDDTSPQVGAGTEVSGEAGAGGSADEEESGGAGAAFEGTAAELLQSVIGGAGALPEVVIDPVTAENAPAVLGLLADDFASYIKDAAVAANEAGEAAFQAAVVLCRYTDDASMIDGLIREGFDPGKWVYVFPDRALTSVSGAYILLAAGSDAETAELAAAFKTTAGGFAQTTVFYEGETGG